jgi:hypothetical protein
MPAEVGGGRAPPQCQIKPKLRQQLGNEDKGERVDRAFWNLFSLGCIIVPEFGGVPMPLTGAIPEGRSFFCPLCGALYAVTYSRLSTSDSNVAKCVVCGRIMAQWDSTKVPTFRLIHRPEDH